MKKRSQFIARIVVQLSLVIFVAFFVQQTLMEQEDLVSQSTAAVEKTFAQETTQSAVQNRLEIPENLTDQQRKTLIYQEAQKGNWALVFKLTEPLAQKGDKEAQTNLGLLYLNGDGVPQDYAKAYWWLNEAAEKGYSKALNNLAYIYYEGLGVNKNIKQSILLFRYASELGSADAMTALGIIYQTNLQEPEEAFKWFKKAAELNEPKAQHYVAQMYQNGHGTQKNYYKAMYWYVKLFARDDQWKDVGGKGLLELGKLIN